MQKKKKEKKKSNLQTHQHLTNQERQYDTFSSTSSLQPSRGVSLPCSEDEGAHTYPDITLINGLGIDGRFCEGRYTEMKAVFSMDIKGTISTSC